MENYELYEFKNGFLKFVKIRDIPVFHCFECKLYFYLCTALQTVLVQGGQKWHSFLVRSNFIKY